MIENIQIITGSPKDVEAKTNAALAAHPKAEIITSSITTSSTADDDATAKKKTKNTITVMVVVGHRF